MRKGLADYSPKNRAGLVIFLIAAGVTCAFIINLCDAIYGCGCRSWWADAAAHCNIHTPGVKRCPWCSIGTVGFALGLVPILGLQMLLSCRPKRWPAGARLVAATLAFPLAGWLAGLVIGWLTGYWAD